MTLENQPQASSSSLPSPAPNSNTPNVRSNEPDYVRETGTTGGNLTAAYLKTVSRYSAHDYQKMIGKKNSTFSLQYFHCKLYISVNCLNYVIFFHFWSIVTCTNITKSTLRCRRTSIHSDRKTNQSGHRHLPQMSTATLIPQMSAPMSMMMLKTRKLVVETHWLQRLLIVVGPLTIRATYVVFGPLEI